MLRPEPRALGLVLVALGLVACTGYAPEIEHPDERCRDASGYEIDCRAARADGVLFVPHEVRAPDRDALDGEVGGDAGGDARDVDRTADDDAAADASDAAPTIPLEGVRAIPPSRPRVVEDDAEADDDKEKKFGSAAVCTH